MSAPTLPSPLPYGDTVLDNFAMLERVVWTQIKAECKQIRDELYSWRFFGTLSLRLTPVLLVMLAFFFIYPDAVSRTSQWVLSSSDALTRFFFSATMSFVFYVGVGILPAFLSLAPKRSPRFYRWLSRFTFHIWLPLYLGFLYVMLQIESPLSLEFFMKNARVFLLAVIRRGVAFWLIAWLISLLIIAYLIYIYVAINSNTLYILMISLKLPKKYDSMATQEARAERIPTHGDFIVKISKTIQPLVTDWPRAHWEPLKEHASLRESALNVQVQLVSFGLAASALLSLLTSFVPEVFDTFFEQLGIYFQFLGPERPSHFLRWMAVLFFIFLIALGVRYFMRAYKQAHILEIIKALCTLHLAESDLRGSVSEKEQNLPASDSATDNQARPSRLPSARFSRVLGALSLVSGLVLLLLWPPGKRGKR